MSTLDILQYNDALAMTLLKFNREYAEATNMTNVIPQTSLLFGGTRVRKHPLPGEDKNTHFNNLHVTESLVGGKNKWNALALDAATKAVDLANDAGTKAVAGMGTTGLSGQILKPKPTPRKPRAKASGGKNKWNQLALDATSKAVNLANDAGTKAIAGLGKPVGLPKPRSVPNAGPAQLGLRGGKNKWNHLALDATSKAVNLANDAASKAIGGVGKPEPKSVQNAKAKLHQYLQGSGRKPTANQLNLLEKHGYIHKNPAVASGGKKSSAEKFAKGFKKGFMGTMDAAGDMAQKAAETATKVAPLVAMAAAGKSNGRTRRAAIVKRVMKDRGVSMIDASRIVKAEGLYQK